MNFNKNVKILFEAVPEFKSFYNEDLNEDYYNSFLGDFGLFTRDAIVNKELYAIKCLNIINDTFNEFYKDIDFINKMTINVLEILTDYYITQKTSVKIFNGNCLVVFKELLNSYFFTDLLGNE